VPLRRETFRSVTLSKHGLYTEDRLKTLLLPLAACALLNMSPVLSEKEVTAFVASYDQAFIHAR
jgi:hypothetical protein